MNIGPLIGAAKGFLGNKYTVRTALGGAMGLKQGTRMWKSTSTVQAALKRKELSFEIKLGDAVANDSFLNPDNLANIIQKQYPQDRHVLKDFTIHYDPATKTVGFEPTEQFIEECLKDTNLMNNTKLKLQIILANTLGFAAFTAALTGAVDGAKKFKDFLVTRKEDEQAKVAHMIFEELEKRAISTELNAIAVNIDLDTVINNHFGE